eukprot:366366-Chlamydomonas_euryale.AAC.2
MKVWGRQEAHAVLERQYSKLEYDWLAVAKQVHSKGERGHEGAVLLGCCEEGAFRVGCCEEGRNDTPNESMHRWMWAWKGGQTGLRGRRR